jgi:hypothetical protein
VRFFSIVIIVELVILAILGLIGWRLGWSTADEYAQGLQTTGLLVIGIGLFGIKGNWDATRGFEYQYSLSATDQSSVQRTQQALIDFAESYRFMLIMFFAGLFTIFIGWLI